MSIVVSLPSSAGVIREDKMPVWYCEIAWKWSALALNKCVTASGFRTGTGFSHRGLYVWGCRRCCLTAKTDFSLVQPLTSDVP